jgi:hypothetical protein
LVWSSRSLVRWLHVAAKDAHMQLRQYIRLMLLCAAGFGGVMEHAERAVSASLKAARVR